MKNFAKALFFLVVLVLLWRVFPLLVRFIEGAAMNATVFWWVILLFAFVGLFFWLYRNRKF